MKHILTIISIKELPKGWEDNCPWSAISVKPFSAAAIRAKLPVGVDLHLWEWADFRDRTSARAWGERMARECLKHNATRFYLDAEAEWCGNGVDYPYVAEPYINLVEAVTAFRATAPKVELAYNGFTWANAADGRKLHDAALIGAFDHWVPMCYGALDDKRFGMRAKLDKYPNLTRMGRIPMLYAGRYDAGGKFIGQDWSQQKRLLGAVGCSEVAWYFGNGSKSRYDDLVEMAMEEIDTSHYVVKRGDSWWALAKTFYNDPTLWPALKKFNGEPVLSVGIRLKIPEKSELA